MKKVYKVLYNISLLNNKFFGNFWKRNITNFTIKLKPYISQLRFLVRSINFKSFGQNCSLGHSVEINCRNIVLDNNVAIRDNVRIGGNGECIIGDGTVINSYTLIACYKKISIGQNVMIAPYVYILDIDHNYENKKIPISKQGYKTDSVIIEDDVWIGTNVIITKGVKIGKGSIVAANSLVNKDIKEYSIYGGTPAKFIKKR